MPICRTLGFGAGDWLRSEPHQSEPGVKSCRRATRVLSRVLQRPSTALKAWPRPGDLRPRGASIPSGPSSQRGINITKLVTQHLPTPSPLPRPRAALAVIASNLKAPPKPLTVSNAPSRSDPSAVRLARLARGSVELWWTEEACGETSEHRVRSVAAAGSLFNQPIQPAPCCSLNPCWLCPVCPSPCHSPPDLSISRSMLEPVKNVILRDHFVILSAKTH